jgi:hypothetical protein
VGDDRDRVDRRFAAVIAVPNAEVAVVWAVAIGVQRYAAHEVSGWVILLTLFGGGLLSLFGAAVSAVELWRGGSDAGWWRAGLAACGAGLAVNLAGFIALHYPKQ